MNPVLFDEAGSFDAELDRLMGETGPHAPGVPMALATLAYFRRYPERVGPRERALLVEAEDHLAEALSLPDDPLLKADQLSLFGYDDVKAPGSRGSTRWHRGKESGKVRYDAPAAPTFAPVSAVERELVAEVQALQPQPIPSGKPDKVVWSEPGQLRPLPDCPLVVSFGAGVDSTAVLTELERRGIRPDAILFADTGGEKPETYAHVMTMQAWCERVGFPAITVVRYVPKTAPYNTLIEKYRHNQSIPDPAFGGGAGASCSDVFKQVPQRKWLEAQSWVADAWANGKRIVKVIGYDNGKGDRKRAQHASTFTTGKDDPALYANWYPLQEWDMAREQCKAAIAAAGVPVPPKSSCTFCPMMQREELEWLADAHPQMLAEAIGMENRAITGWHPIRGPKGLGNRVKSTWGALFRDHAAVQAELAKLPTDHRFGSVVQFGSGASAPAHFGAFMRATMPVGVVATLLSERVRGMVADYARAHGRVFVDSGAFGDFNAGRATDWPKVRAAYDAVLDAVMPARWRRLYMVGPDVIGDQAASLRLQAEWAPALKDWVRGRIDKPGEPPKKGKKGNGVRLLLPIQLGALPPSEVYRRQVAMLGTDDFAVLVPSNQAAFSVDDLRELLTARPAGVHLAGIGGNKRVRELIAVIRRDCPTCSITTDSNRIKAWVGNDGPSRKLTVAKKDVLPFRWLGVMARVDEERILEDPALWSDAKVRTFADYVGEQPGHVKRALATGRVGFAGYLDELRDRFEAKGDRGDRALVDDGLHLAFHKELNPGPDVEEEELAKLLVTHGVGPVGEDVSLTPPAPLGKALPAIGEHRELMRERERIWRDLYYLHDEDIPAAQDAGIRLELERRRRLLEHRLSYLNGRIGT